MSIKMRVAIVRYPGSNCDNDTLRYFENSFYIWHTESKLDNYDFDLLVLPGGFAFGDRKYEKATGSYIVSPGTKATESPVTNVIMEVVKRNIPILGICNGFQILIQLGLLSGKLIQNKTKRFVCKKVECKCCFVSSNSSTMYIANGYGNYIPDEHSIPFLKYTSQLAEYDSDIAGVCNSEFTIFGMMPHPERNSTNFRPMLQKLMFKPNPERPHLHTQSIFESKVNELMHSEHISYKSTRRFLKELHTKEDWVVQGPGENAGIVDIGNGYCIALRIESHNHPTFINPYEGAATGVGGILRDIFTMGARPIAILDFLRFGKDKTSDELLDIAIEGIAYYGNCVGVPNIGGDLLRCESYNKNPLVNVGCIGIVKKENIIYGSVSSSSDVLVYIGSKTGKEGVGGAAMASKVFEHDIDKGSLQDNVQKSDPFLEKLLIDACCEISELKLATGMQDMGAGGLLCSSIELISRGSDKTGQQLGCSINLDKVPIKHKMDSHDILMSESQERMLLATSVDKLQDISKILRKWDLEYAIIGQVNNSGDYSVYDQGALLYTEKISNFVDVNDYTYNEDNYITRYTEPEKTKDMSKWSVYDSTVGNRTIKGPDTPGSYAILNIHEINKFLFVTWGETFYECYNKMKEFKGVKPLAMVNCLNYGHPKDSLTDLSSTVSDLAKICAKYNVPIVGGNVSLYNSTDDKSIRPTPILMMIGIN